MNRVLDAFTLPICLSRPRRVTSVAAWKEHIPFAMNLVAAIRPRVLVELGIGAGDSYCAFCQAVAEGGLGTRCYAVVNGTSDQQAGVSGPEALADLRRHHDPAYGGFSTLLESTFDDALLRFPDGSVDLLHIEVPRAPGGAKLLEGWLPKMSASGVVLLHDIDSRGSDRGSLWGELEARFPHFEFLHGRGLGVLAVGEEPPQALLPLLVAGQDDVRVIRAFFSELGRRVLTEGASAMERVEVGPESVGASSPAPRAELELPAVMQRTTVTEARIAELEARTSSLLERVATLVEEKASVEHENASLGRELAAHRAAHQFVTQTAAWRAATRYWRARDRLLAPGTTRRFVFDRAVRLLRGKPAGEPGGAARAGGSPRAVESAPLSCEARYRTWIERNHLGPERIAEMRGAASALEFRPLVSVLTPVFETEEELLRRCIESVLGQAYDHWELCLVADVSTKPSIASVLAEYAARDPRIRTARVERESGLAPASVALSMAQGEFIALLGHDDALSPDALFEVARAIRARRDLDLVYSDEDELNPQGRRVAPFFKPGWSPDLLLSMNYIGHLTVLRRSLAAEAGGFREGFGDGRDYDLLLRVTERSDRILRIPKVLYHRRKGSGAVRTRTGADPRAAESAKRALEEALVRRGIGGTVSMPAPGRYRVVYALPDPPPRVSVIIPTRDRANLLRTCIGSIEARTRYPNYEILVVDNGSSERNAVRYLREIGARHRVIPRDVPFNWSAINNFAARRAEGDLLLFMNNDMEVVNEGWLGAMVEHAIRPNVGAVGAKLLYPSRRIQHAGVVLGVGGIAGHVFKHLLESDWGYHSLHQVVRDCSAVTGACMMVPRRVFEDLGGFDEDLRVAFNDVDFCLRLRARGQLVVWTPFATLLHFESASRKALHPPEDEALMRDRWATAIADDPYYNPNLTLDHEDCRIRF